MHLYNKKWMVNSAKRARRRRLAQEAQRREGSRSAHQMDPANLSGPETDQEGDEDQEIMFAPRVVRVEEPPPAPEIVQPTTDRDIINMVKTAVSQGTVGIRRAYVWWNHIHLMIHGPPPLFCMPYVMIIIYVTYVSSTSHSRVTYHCSPRMRPVWGLARSYVKWPWSSMEWFGCSE